MTWSETGDTGGLVFDEPLDLSAGRLELRTIVDPELGDVRIRLRLTDASGASAVHHARGRRDRAGRCPSTGRVGKRWAQAVIADPGAAAGIDLTQVVRLDVIGDSSDGRLWILDVAAAPDTLAAVPERRLPAGQPRLAHGRRGRRAGHLRRPAAVHGDRRADPSRPARRSASSTSPPGAGANRLRLDLAPGQTEGSIRYEYTGNTVDDYAAAQ